MAKVPRPPKGPVADEDMAQSQLFIEAARKLEADGGLSPTEGEAAFDQLLRKAAPASRPTRE